nr:MAG TPA: hypothetical protein [Caudoviricetes sp.]
MKPSDIAYFRFSSRVTHSRLEAALLCLLQSK